MSIQSRLFLQNSKSYLIFELIDRFLSPKTKAKMPRIKYIRSLDVESKHTWSETIVYDLY